MARLEKPPLPPGVAEAVRLQRAKEISSAMRDICASKPRVLGAVRDRLSTALLSASVDDLRRIADRRPGTSSPPTRAHALLMAQLELLRRGDTPAAGDLAAPGRGLEAVRGELAAPRGDLERAAIARTRGEQDGKRL